MRTKISNKIKGIFFNVKDSEDWKTWFGDYENMAIKDIVEKTIDETSKQIFIELYGIINQCQSSKPCNFKDSKFRLEIEKLMNKYK